MFKKRYQENIRNVKQEFKKLMKSFIAVAIALSIPVASFNLFRLLGNKIYSDYSYDVSKDTYRSYDNSFTHSDERSIIDSNKTAYVVKYDTLSDDDIDKYNPRITEKDAMWYRKKTVYDLSYLEYQNINDYLDYWNSDAVVPVSSSEIVEIKGNNDIVQEYVDYYELVYNVIDLESKNVEESFESNIFSISVTVGITIIEFVYLCMSLLEFDSNLHLISILKKYLNDKENLKNDKKLYIDKTKELLMLIGQDEKLRELFNIEAAKYGYLFEEYGLMLPKETIDKDTKKKLLEGK